MRPADLVKRLPLDQQVRRDEIVTAVVAGRDRHALAERMSSGDRRAAMSAKALLVSRLVVFFAISEPDVFAQSTYALAITSKPHDSTIKLVHGCRGDGNTEGSHRKGFG
jgi:hypothetical protein